MIMKDELEKLKGQEVEINCNGFTYKGCLLETTEDEIHIQTPLQFLTLPLGGVSQIKKLEHNV